MDAPMAQGGEIRAYRGKAYLTDDAESAPRSSDFNATDANGNPLVAASTTGERWVLTTRQDVPSWRHSKRHTGRRRVSRRLLCPGQSARALGQCHSAADGTGGRRHTARGSWHDFRHDSDVSPVPESNHLEGDEPGGPAERASMVHEVPMPFWESNRSYLTVAPMWKSPSGLTGTVSGSTCPRGCLRRYRLAQLAYGRRVYAHSQDARVPQPDAQHEVHAHGQPEFARQVAAVDDSVSEPHHPLTPGVRIVVV